MELTDYHIELLEKKFFKKLSESETAELITLERNPDFVDEAAKYLAILEGIKHDSKEELKTKLTEWDSDKSNVVKPSFNWNRVLKFAAILVFCISGLFFVSKFLQPSTDSLSEFYEPYPNRVTTRTGTEDSVLSVAMLHYEEKKYQECKITLINRTDVIGVLYRGHCSFNLGEYLNAKEDYRRVLINEQSVAIWKETAEWYHLLSMLQIDQFDKQSMSYKKLQELASSNHSYQNQADDLLLRLEKIK